MEKPLAQQLFEEIREERRLEEENLLSALAAPYIGNMLAAGLVKEVLDEDGNLVEIRGTQKLATEIAIQESCNVINIPYDLPC